VLHFCNCGMCSFEISRAIFQQQECNAQICYPIDTDNNHSVRPAQLFCWVDCLINCLFFERHLKQFFLSMSLCPVITLLMPADVVVGARTAVRAPTAPGDGVSFERTQQAFHIYAMTCYVANSNFLQNLIVSQMVES
jgi:hypothetical protein